MNTLELLDKLLDKIGNTIYPGYRKYALRPVPVRVPVKEKERQEENRWKQKTI